MVLIGLFSNQELLPLLSVSQDTSISLEVSDPPERRPQKQAQVRLTSEQIDELVAAYQAGASVRQLVERFGIHRTTVLDHLERRGVPRRRNTRKLTDDQVQQAARYYRAGNSLATTGQRFGVDAATITREFAKAGVEVRPRKG